MYTERVDKNKQRLERSGRMTQASAEVAEYSVQRGSFWTSKQRQGHSINEISYRACFKPQLPQYFIDRYSDEGDVVLDPFLGRGTTAVQSVLSGRIAYGSDINPLSVMLTRPRLSPPDLDAVAQRFESIPKDCEIKPADQGLLAFYHPDTLRHLLALKEWFIAHEGSGNMTTEDDWLRMIILNRLSGHSPGFLSVKTMPPNQAVSIARQERINAKHGRVPEKKDILDIVLRKSKSLLRSGLPVLSRYAAHHRLESCDARRLDYIKDGEVALVVTSPPFLNVVDYAQDNWLRCWFAGIDMNAVKFDDHASVEDWSDFVSDVFAELDRVVKPGGHVAFEVGEVRNGSLKLENNVTEAIEHLPFEVEGVLLNEHEFTKTANCWGVDNNTRGTNSNRIVIARRK